MMSHHDHRVRRKLIPEQHLHSPRGLRVRARRDLVKEKQPPVSARLAQSHAAPQHRPRETEELLVARAQLCRVDGRVKAALGRDEGG